MRIVDAKQYTPSTRWIFAEGMSTETKPTSGLVTGSRFRELDTGVMWTFDETTQQWYNGNGGMTEKTGNAIAANLATLINAQYSEHGKEIAAKDVNLYDYDGTVLYAYTAEEFLALTALPPIPAHDGLLAQGWNWTLANAQTYVTAYGVCEIGANYITNDGKTRAVIDIGEPESLKAYLKFQQSTANAVIIDWGDESETETAEGTTAVSISHTYAEAGRYTITLTVPTGETMVIGNNGTYQSGFVGQGATGWVGRSILRELYVGERVTGIAEQGLWHQTRLEILTLPVGLTTIASRSIEANFKLKALNIPSGVTTINDYVFRCDYDLEVLTFPDTVTTFKSPCMTCVALKRVTIPAGPTSLGAQAFQRCFEATVINVPASVVTFGANCFENCYELRSINVPSGVTAIPNSFARQCHNLREITIPEGVTSIGQMAFSGNFGISELVIPSTVTSIAQFAFLYNDGANSFYVKATTPPTLQATAFTGINGEAVIYVPYSEDHSVLDAYLAATNWSGLGDSIQEEAAPAE